MRDLWRTVRRIYIFISGLKGLILDSGSKESLDEVTIKDTLDGDNMYTCSQCGKKVRAEKR